MLLSFLLSCHCPHRVSPKSVTAALNDEDLSNCSSDLVSFILLSLCFKAELCHKAALQWSSVMLKTRPDQHNFFYRCKKTWLFGTDANKSHINQNSSVVLISFFCENENWDAKWSLSLNESYHNCNICQNSPSVSFWPHLAAFLRCARSQHANQLATSTLLCSLCKRRMLVPELAAWLTELTS